MILTKDQLTAITYLWTRDGKMDISESTEEYIIRELEILFENDVHIYSDLERKEMAFSITNEFMAR